MNTFLLGLSLMFTQGALFYDDTLNSTLFMLCINLLIYAVLPLIKKFVKTDLGQLFELDDTTHLVLGIVMGYHTKRLYTDFSYPFVSPSVLSCLFWFLLNIESANII